MTSIFLEYHGSTGRVLHVRLPEISTSGSCFLPDQVDEFDDNFNLSLFRTSNTHSIVRLETHADHVLLSVWSLAPEPVYILHREGIYTEVPVSTYGRETSFILTHGCQFITPASRWRIDFSHVKTCHSLMKPPPLPLRLVSPPEIFPKEEATSSEDESIEQQTSTLCSGKRSDSEGVAKFDTSCTESSTTIGESAPGKSSLDLQISDDTRRKHQEQEEPISDPTSFSTNESEERIPMTPKPQILDDGSGAKEARNQAVALRSRKRTRIDTIPDAEPPSTPSKQSKAKNGTSRPMTTQSLPTQETSKMIREPQKYTGLSQVEEDTVVLDMDADQYNDVERRPTKRQHVSSVRSKTTTDSLKVIFSSNCIVQTRRKTMKTFIDLGCEIVDCVEHADILCVPDGSLRRTTKFILAVALGKRIVAESWVVECSRRQNISSTEHFVPKDQTREEQWNFSLQEAMNRDLSETGKVLDGWTVHVTPQLMSSLGDLLPDFGKIAKALGVKKFQRGLPNKSADRGHLLVLGDDNDADARNVRLLGLCLHKKDALVLAALRGYHDSTSKEFRL